MLLPVSITLSMSSVISLSFYIFLFLYFFPSHPHTHTYKKVEYALGRFLVWPANSSTTMDAKVAQDFLKGKDGRAASGTLFMVNPLRDGTTRARAISRLSAFGKEKVRRTCLWCPPHLPLLSDLHIALTIPSLFSLRRCYSATTRGSRSPSGSAPRGRSSWRASSTAPWTTSRFVRIILCEVVFVWLCHFFSSCRLIANDAQS